MSKDMKKRISQIISLVLIAALTLLAFSACNRNNFQTPSLLNPYEDISSDGKTDNTTSDGNPSLPGPSEPDDGKDLPLVMSGLSYAEILATVDRNSTLNLLITLLLYNAGFYAFDALAVIGEESVNGVGFYQPTNPTGQKINGKTYINCGFISDSRSINNTEIEEGIFVYDLESDEAEYVLTDIGALTDYDFHIVYDGYYYAVDFTSVATYHSFIEPYDSEKQYDWDKYGSLNELSGKSIRPLHTVFSDSELDLDYSAQALRYIPDYDGIWQKVEEILRTQEINGYKIDQLVQVSFSEDNINVQIALEQIATFFGIPLSTWNEIENDLQQEYGAIAGEDYFFTIDANGDINVEVMPPLPPPPPASIWEKILTTVICAVTVASSIALMFIPVVGPALGGAALGATLSGSIELCTQMYKEGRSIGNYDWKRVGCTMAMGAVDGLISTFVGSVLGGAISGVLSGVEGFAMGLLSGQTIDQALISGAIGLGVGVGIGVGVGSITKYVGKAIANRAARRAPQIVSKTIQNGQEIVFDDVQLQISKNAAKKITREVPEALASKIDDISAGKLDDVISNTAFDGIDTLISHTDDAITKSKNAAYSVIDDIESGKIKLDALSNKQKGNYGEMSLYKSAEDWGLVNVMKNSRCPQLDSPIHHGIDAVYFNPKTNEYIIFEAKFGTSSLNVLSDGTTKQMSVNWINDRLEQAVGKDIAKDIGKKGYKSILFHVDENFTKTIYLLDDNANKLGKITEI